MILPVTEENLIEAARVHATSWRESHDFCSPEFVAAHTTQRQADYFRKGMAEGKRFFLLEAGEPAAVVSVHGDCIGDLYVLPQRQGKGLGTRLLHYAETLCGGTPTLWVLSNNRRAIAFYLNNGYHFTGREKALSAELSELEMRR